VALVGSFTPSCEDAELTSGGVDHLPSVISPSASQRLPVEIHVCSVPS
jgi:hypothetical protein